MIAHFKRTIRKEGQFSQREVGHLFQAIIFPNLLTAYPSRFRPQHELYTIKCLLKIRYRSHAVDIKDLMETHNRKIFKATYL